MDSRTEEIPTEAPPPLEGDYRLLKLLGEGGFGEVWLARHVPTGDKVAIKFLTVDPEAREVVEYFKREFEILCGLRHVHLARVFEFGFSRKREQYFFTSEFCPGQNLREAVAGKDAAYFEEILVQILSALDCIHSQGIVHLDIKPDNILVDDRDGRPQVKLLDFGVAVKLKAVPEKLGGTLAYMAPEMLGESGRLDHRADLYSLGMVCLVALTGRFPFPLDDSDAVREWHLKGRVPERLWEGKGVPAHMRDVTERLLAKNPSERFSNSRVVLNFLNLATRRKYLEVERDLQAQIPIEGPLVERGPVVEFLKGRIDAWLGNASSRGEVHWVTGEQGIGKSRILSEIRHYLELKEVPFFKTNCDWQIPTWPQIEKHFGLPRAAADDPSEDWQIRRRMDALLETARSRPAVLLVDDLHKAEDDFKRLIGALSDLSGGSASVGEAPPARLWILAATEESRAGAIPLSRLGRAGIESYLRLTLGEADRLEELALLLERYSGGLPLLTVEGLRYLVPHFARGESLEDVLPPPEIRLLYEPVLRTLGEGEKELLETLALIFRPARLEELEAVLGLSPPALAASAEEALRKGLVARDRDRDALMVSSQALALDLIQSLEPGRRRVLHGKIASGFRRAPGTPPEEVAYHLGKAGEVDEAIGLYREAERALIESGQVSSAKNCLMKALALASPGTEAWNDLNLETARLLTLSGAFQEADARLKALEANPSPLLFKLKGNLALKMLDLPKARACYEEGLSLLTSSPEADPAERIILENFLANVDLQEGKFDDAAGRFRKTLSEERSLPAGKAASILNNNLGFALLRLGDADGAIAFYEERLLRLAFLKKSDRVTLLNSAAYVYLQARRYDRAVPCLREAMQLAEETGAMHVLFTIMGNLIVALLAETAYGEALPLIKKMVRYQERLGNARDVCFNLLREGTVYLDLGMTEAARECLETGQTRAAETGSGGLLLWFLLMRGYLEMELGSLERAAEIFKECKAEAVKSNDAAMETWADYSQAELAFLRKDMEACRAVASVMKPQTSDGEFKIRFALIQAKCGLPDPDPKAVRRSFQALAELCERERLREISWQVLAGWAAFEAQKGRKQEAVALYDRAIGLIESIAASLPEELRPRYVQQRSRRVLYTEREQLTGKTGLLSKVLRAWGH